jgi:hypothetical protein
MWEQARARANELDSLVLWCDGGKGGVSGIGGRGLHDITQLGEGSWVRTVGVNYPFNANRTMWAKHGTKVSFLILGCFGLAAIFGIFVSTGGYIGAGWQRFLTLRRGRSSAHIDLMD